jgi:hypothetical protein
LKLLRGKHWKPVADRRVPYLSLLEVMASQSPKPRVVIAENAVVHCTGVSYQNQFDIVRESYGNGRFKGATLRTV